MYIHRTYRDFNKNEKLIPFQVSIKETDLYIKALKNLKKEALSFISLYRDDIENYILSHPDFEKSLVPLPYDGNAPLIIKEMLKASSLAGVGPMASVAGAIAEFVGTSLLRYSSDVIVENGGDIFISTAEEVVVEIFAGGSPLSQKIGIKVLPPDMPLGVCTSSGTVGPSLSFGKADAVTVVSPSTALADAVATAVGNKIRKPEDIPSGLKVAESLAAGIKGVVIILGEKMGVWGNIELVKL